jgi:glucose-6-phosphate 1-dehydrogenase
MRSPQQPPVHCLLRSRSRDRWELYTPVLQAWAAKRREVFPNYSAGSWGLECSDHLLERERRAWRNDLGRKA